LPHTFPIIDLEAAPEVEVDLGVEPVVGQEVACGLGLRGDRSDHVEAWKFPRRVSAA